MSSLAPNLVIGVGNRDRGDDAVGPIVCDRVGALAIAGLRVVVLESAVVDLSTYWERGDRVVVVDAVRPNGDPGRIVELDAACIRPGATVTMSTHSIDVAFALRLARVMQRMPADLRIFGVEGASFEFGAPLGADVERGVDELVARLASSIATVM